MPSIQELRQSRKSQFEPKWRHFHPQSRVWVENPFDEDIVFYVADEANEQWKYRMKANAVSELPGGAVATLGVKEIVDRLIGESSNDAVHIWVLKTRAKYESRIIKRIKEPPQKAARHASGEIDLSAGVNKDDLNEDADDNSLQAEHPAEEGRQTADEAKNPGAKRGNQPRGLDKVKAIAQASAPAAAQSQVVEEE